MTGEEARLYLYCAHCGIRVISKSPSAEPNDWVLCSDCYRLAQQEAPR